VSPEERLQQLEVERERMLGLLEQLEVERERMLGLLEQLVAAVERFAGVEPTPPTPRRPPCRVLLDRHRRGGGRP
jgi:hypothetical protein